MPIYPPKMLRDPRIIAAMKHHGIPSPISVEHSLIACARCGEQCWIGPKQRQGVENGMGEAVCFYCLPNEPDLGDAPIYGLNPDIDNAPRRTT